VSTLVLIGSARSDGHTALAARRLCRALGGTRAIDLAARTIEPFRYDRTDDRDDFRSIVGAMLAHPTIVLATPVYWYAMSGVMKRFFDRLTDLLMDADARSIGRALAVRDLWVLATGTDPALPPGFDEPFARTAGYFGMTWRGSAYVQFTDGELGAHADLSVVERFADQLRG